jgi:hypothetical protein
MQAMLAVSARSAPALRVVAVNPYVADAVAGWGGAGVRLPIVSGPSTGELGSSEAVEPVFV